MPSSISAIKCAGCGHMTPSQEVKLVGDKLLCPKCLKKPAATHQDERQSLG